MHALVLEGNIYSHTWHLSEIQYYPFNIFFHSILS